MVNTSSFTGPLDTFLKSYAPGMQAASAFHNSLSPEFKAHKLILTAIYISLPPVPLQTVNNYFLAVNNGLKLISLFFVRTNVRIKVCNSNLEHHFHELIDFVD